MIEHFIAGVQVFIDAPDSAHWIYVKKFQSIFSEWLEFYNSNKVLIWNISALEINK